MAMDPLVFVFVGTLAVLGSVGAMRSRLEAETRVLAAMFSLVAWGTWALNAFEIETQAGTNSHQGLAFLGLAAAVIMLLFAVRYGWQTARSENERDGGVDIAPENL